MFVVLSLVGLIVIIYDPSTSSRHLIGVALLVALAGGAFAPASLTPLGLGCALVV